MYKYYGLLIFTFIIQWLTTYYVYKKIDWTQKPLKDILLDNVKIESKYYTIANKMLGLALIMIIYQSLKDKDYAKKVIVCYSIFSLIRALCKSSTILPIPKGDRWCFEDKNMTFWEVTINSLQGNTCGDYTLSAHAAVITFAMLPLLQSYGITN